MSLVARDTSIRRDVDVTRHAAVGRRRAVEALLPLGAAGGRRGRRGVDADHVRPTL